MRVYCPSLEGIDPLILCGGTPSRELFKASKKPLERGSSRYEIPSMEGEKYILGIQLFHRDLQYTYRVPKYLLGLVLVIITECFVNI
jgi:hypothetical protein